MLISAKIEYTYKAIFELSLRYSPGVPVQLGTISKTQKIPQKFLVQLLLRLKNAGLVNSTRGIGGGYYLARPPARISMADVIRAVDDTLLELPRQRKGQSRRVDSDALLQQVWGAVSKDMSARLEKATFDQLIARLKGGQVTYQI